MEGVIWRRLAALVYLFALTGGGFTSALAAEDGGSAVMGVLTTQTGYDPATGANVADLTGIIDPAAESTDTQAVEAAQPASQATTTETDTQAETTTESVTSITTTDSDRRFQARDTLIIEYQLPETLAEDTAQAVAQVLDQRLFYLDANGVLNLPIVGAVPLAGLNQQEAVSRLKAEQLFREITLTVQVLPVEPQGATALKMFGYDLFTNAENNFAPATGLPTPANYVVGPGDTIQIQLYGQKSDAYELTVTPEGVLNFPELGPVTVAGMTFREVDEEIKKRISTQLIGVTANVTIGPLSSITVFVVGEVNAPGSYTVSALSTMTNALASSGGIKQTGSLRNIQLKRDGQLVSQLDLYDLLMRGDKGGDERLRSNDVIFVAPRGPIASVSGEVLRPAIYELSGERSAQQLLALAGGMTPNARPGWARVERIEPERGRVTLDVDLSNRAGLATSIKPGDTLTIPSATERVEGEVTLQGHVRNPGNYPWRTGLTVSDLIRSEWDLLPDADLDYALLVRHRAHTEAMAIESVQFREVLDGKKWVALMPRDTLIVFRADQNADRQALLKPLLDQLRQQARAGVPSPVVSIGGMVGAPGDYPLEAGMKISGLLRASGKLNESAYTLDAELTRYRLGVDGARTVEHLPVDLAGVLSGKPGADLALTAFDHLLIRPAPAWESQNSVQLQGEVRFPGTYPISRGEKLSSVIQRAGGITDLAYPRGAVFLREELKAREAEQLARLADRLEASLAAAAQNKLATPDQEEAITVGSQLLSEVRATQPMGRLVIDLPNILDKDKVDSGGVTDVVLKGGDVLYVPEVSQDVMVMGEVYYPTTHLWGKDQDWADYVNLSGGYTEKSDKKRVYVIRANGAVVPAKKLSSFNSGWKNQYEDTAWSFADGSSMQPGDTIIVPLDVDRYKSLDLVSKLSSIFYQIGSTAAQLERAYGNN